MHEELTTKRTTTYRSAKPPGVKPFGFDSSATAPTEGTDDSSQAVAARIGQVKRLAYGWIAEPRQNECRICRYKRLLRLTVAIRRGDV